MMREVCGSSLIPHSRGHLGQTYPTTASPPLPTYYAYPKLTIFQAA